MRFSPLGGPYITKTTVLAALLVAIMGSIIVVRLFFGLNVVTNLNDGFSWGIWLAYDVVAGTAIACGGYSVALVVYVLNKGKYHPLVRPAILASMFGYGLGGFSVLVDISRWWNFWHILWPSYYNPNSVMLEVALCIATYTFVLVLEFAPAVVEWLAGWTGEWGRRDLHKVVITLKKWLNKVVFVFIALGMTLPTMHQSSLGTMLIPFGDFINPLWQTPALPGLYLLTALSMGYAIILFEGTLVADRFRLPSEARILGFLSRYMITVVIMFVLVRWGDLAYQGKLHYVYTQGWLSFAFLMENILYITPVVILVSKERRMAPRYQFISAMCMLSGGILYRIDSYLLSYFRVGWHYFPSAPEILVTFGMIAVEILGYMLFVQFFPVIHSTERAQPAPLTSN